MDATTGLTLIPHEDGLYFDSTNIMDTLKEASVAEVETAGFEQYLFTIEDVVGTGYLYLTAYASQRLINTVNGETTSGSKLRVADTRDESKGAFEVASVLSSAHAAYTIRTKT